MRANSTTSLVKDGAVLVASVEMATSWMARAAGLMGQKPLGGNRALYLSPCRCVHTCFMRFPLDLVFLDQSLRVVRIVRNIVPWRMASGGSKARSVLELEAGWLPSDTLVEGDRVELGWRNSASP